jgi:hypothetical protein
LSDVKPASGQLWPVFCVRILGRRRRVFSQYLLSDVRIVRICATKAFKYVDALADIVLVNKIHRSFAVTLLGVCLRLAGLEVEPPYICTPWLKNESIFFSYELVKTLPDYLCIFTLLRPELRKIISAESTAYNMRARSKLVRLVRKC